MFDITEIILAFFALIGTVITTILIPYIKSKTTTEQQYQINDWVRIAVLAAEQAIKGDKKGPERKQRVIDFLATKGFKLDEAALDALIEAAVLELNNGLIV